MSNENAAVCGCGITVDVSRRKVPVPLPIWRHGKSDGRSSKKQQNDGRGSKNRNSETGSSSSVSDHAKPMTKSSKQEKRLNHQMRSRSVERGKTYYTYIDSNSSILSGGNRETIPEALYVTIPDTPNATANDTGNSLTNSQNRSPLVYTIPSMTSPPPTYDASVAKSWQSDYIEVILTICIWDYQLEIKEKARNFWNVPSTGLDSKSRNFRNFQKDGNSWFDDDTM
uniref:Uncharacterized protein n=1 Tax=Vespula pensylvanica TaxID=30213 RepID=A0A834UCR6_VESPE|nr:hypothetical protein H0235_004206 [Vespula pensylvanica]